METYCESCGAYDTYRSNGDNSMCAECGDTEGLRFMDDYELFIATTTLGGSCPGQHLKIYAENEINARIIARSVLGKDWAFIYPEKQGLSVLENWNKQEHKRSPIFVKEHEVAKHANKIRNKSNK